MRFWVSAAIALSVMACDKKGSNTEAKVEPAPAATAPAEKPAEAKPAEKPAEAKPAEAKPAEAKPAEVKPAEEKPAEVKPAEEKPAEPAAAPEPEAKPMAKAPKPALTEAQKSEGKEKSQSFWKLVNEGRGLVRKDKNYDAGIAKYMEALKVLPNHPTALGEAGYAALLKGDLDEADRFTELALSQQKNYKKRGMLWYNKGQILEKRGDPRGALNAYRSSYAARKNDTVKGRIDALSSQMGEAPKKTMKALAGLCKDIEKEWGCATGKEKSCTCGKRFIGPATSGLTRAAILRVEGSPAEAFGTIDAEYLAVNYQGDEWHMVGMVTNGFSPGAFGIYNSGTIQKLGHEVILPGAGAAIVVVAENTNDDSDMGYNALTSDTSWTMTVCWLEGTVNARCAEIPLGKAESLSKIVDDGETPPESEYGPLHDTRWKLDASFDGQGNITVKVVEGEVPADLAGLVGTFAWTDFISKDGVALRDL